jgi:pectin methylesterase-like acyl-CoA thioesterase
LGAAGSVCLFLCASIAAEVPPAKTVVWVGGAAAQFKTVQAAVDAAPEQGSIIHIAPGRYYEKIAIARNGIALLGAGTTPEKVVLIYDDGARFVGGTGKSGSVSVSGDDFVAENLTIQNDFERTHDRKEEGSQAVALLLTGDRAVLRNVRILGYQDTLYASSKFCHAPQDAAEDKPCHASRQLFSDCYIEGHVDFIFGDAKAVFDRCEIHAVASPEAMLTAQSRLYPGEDSGYLFLHCTITSAPGVGKLVLGRPWRGYATVYWVDSTLKGARLDPAGWQEWAGKLATSSYGEYHTIYADGTAADTSARIAPSRQLSAAEARKLTAAAWLAGPDGWNPTQVSAAYLP